MFNPSLCLTPNLNPSPNPTLNHSPTLSPTLSRTPPPSLALPGKASNRTPQD